MWFFFGVCLLCVSADQGPALTCNCLGCNCIKPSLPFIPNISLPTSLIFMRFKHNKLTKFACGSCLTCFFFTSFKISEVHWDPSVAYPWPCSPGRPRTLSFRRISGPHLTWGLLPTSHSLMTFLFIDSFIVLELIWLALWFLLISFHQTHQATDFFQAISSVNFWDSYPQIPGTAAQCRTFMLSSFTATH